jgi:hypothetical protein
MILNNGATDLTLTGFSVTSPSNGSPVSFNNWPTLSITLHAGENAIFTQTPDSFENFDSSDHAYISSTDPTNNCSVGALSSTGPCTSSQPIISLIVNGTPMTLTDSAHVLDTGGYDIALSTPCVGANNGGVTAPNCNESLQWRLIGTTGLDNPGGTGVAEPGILALFGAGLLGLGWARRARKS